MKLLIEYFHLRSLRALIFLSFLAVVSLGVMFSKDVFADNPNASSAQRLVTIHDGDAETVRVTRAMTVGDALKEAGVTLDERDIVEPAADAKMVAKAYQVNVFRARPVVIIDGARQIRVMTAEQSPRQIAKGAGVALFDEDTTTFERVDSLLAGGGAGMRMVITRAKTFDFTLYGKRFAARTQAKTVGEMLKEKSVVLGEADGVTPAKETPLTEGVSVRVWRNGKQTLTQEEAIPRPVEEIKDADKTVGTRETQQEGADGKRNVTYQIEMKDGVETSRTEIASVTTQEPVKQVVIVGTKVTLPSGSHTDWMAAAGIAPGDYGYVDYIISHESGWGVTKSNYGGSGAYGLCQALPGSKMATAGSDWATNPITQLKWCNGYAVGRYGSWAGAYNFWIANKWW